MMLIKKVIPRLPRTLSEQSGCCVRWELEDLGFHTVN